MKIFIEGTGTMGPGIAQVFAQGGHGVLIHHHESAQKAQDSINGIEKRLARLVDRGKMDAPVKDALLARIKPCEFLEDATSCDLTIEAIAENMEVKRDFFAKMDKICKPEAIFATNTSSLSITEIAEAVKRQGQFIGLHFFNPAPVMKLVEVIRGLKTSDATLNTTFSLCKELGKDPIEVKEAPGFVVNKILIPMINEAICVLDEGTASAEDIDLAMRLGAGHPMGPLALSDFIGNDIVLNIMSTLHSETGDPKYRPAPLLRKMVRAGYLGAKSGEGFHKYSK
jgi:3-hydroxybutyryl-CoA dehydrogenase